MLKLLADKVDTLTLTHPVVLGKTMTAQWLKTTA